MTKTGNIIRALRKRKGWSQEKLAEQVHVSRQLVSHWENKPNVVPGADDLVALSALFGVGVESLLGMEPKEPIHRSVVPSHRVPVLGDTACGEPILAEQNIEDYIDLPADLAAGSELVAVRIHGDSMEGAHLTDGNLALIQVQDDVDNGQIALVCIGDNRDHSTIKKYRREDGYVSLTPIPREDRVEDFRMLGYPASKVRVVGRVVGVWWG